MKNYVSLMIDIENSRSYTVTDRNSMQEFIVKCMEQLNVVFKYSLKFSMVFSAGDEIQGLFRDMTSTILYLRIFEMLVSPVRIRAGIGIGEWNIKIERGLSTQQDGPAYHRARQAIKEVYNKQTQRYRICSEKEDELANHLMNASYPLKEQQGYMQNIAQIIMELLYPFEKKDLISYHFKTIQELLEMKYHYRIGMRAMQRYSIAGTSSKYAMEKSEGSYLNSQFIKVIEPVYIDGINYDAEKEIVKKNMSSNIAEVMGCKRQNADMLVKRGNSIVIRAMDYMALQYIERNYRENGI